MKYLVQSNHSRCDDVPACEIMVGWEKINSSRAGNQEFDDLATAKRVLKFNSNLARCIMPMRAVDTEGRVYGYYDVEQDMRLPGCRWRATKKRAEALWEAAGKPDGDDLRFWYEAEQQVIAEDNESFIWLQDMPNVPGP